MKIIEVVREIKSKYPRLDLSDIRVMRNNLVFVLHLIAASEDLLKNGISQLSNSTDPFDVKLREYFKTHLLEEAGHHAWLLDDIDGIDAPLNWTAAEMAGTQYYLINHVHPASLLGYMAVLEGDPVPIDVVESLESLHGKRFFRTIRYHAEHDLDHREDVFKLIDELPDNLQQIVLENAITTAHRLGMAQMNMRTYG